MYLEDLKIDATRADDDQFYRIPRINRVIGYAQALAGDDSHPSFLEKVKSFYDHKGTLTIVWNTAPTEDEIIYLQTAWESIVTDYEDRMIDHQIID